MKIKEFKNETDLFNFGKHSGKSLAYVCFHDFEYINWCIANIEGFKINEELWDSLKKNRISTTPEVIEINSLTELEYLVDKVIKLLIEKRILSNLYEKDYSVHPELNQNDIMNSVRDYNVFIEEQSILKKSIERINTQLAPFILAMKNHLLKNGIKANDNVISFSHENFGYENLETIILRGTLNEDHLALSSFKLVYRGDCIAYSFDLDVI